MMLGATHDAIIEAGILLGLGALFGGMYVCLYFLRLYNSSRAIGFIYDFIYAIVIGGIFILTMLKINMLDIKYYHILATILGILLAGILPVHCISKHEKAILERINCIKAHFRRRHL